MNILFNEQARMWKRNMDRVANVDMSVPSMRCPNGYATRTSPRSCHKHSSSACSSAYFPTFKQFFKKVCGKIIGYQKGSPDAFSPYSRHPSKTVDHAYVDGVSVTYNNPREHIWTFAAQPDTIHKKFDSWLSL